MNALFILKTNRRAMIRGGVIMSRDVYSIDQIKTKLTPILSNYGVKRAVLFGSYGKGHPTPESDLDILVDSKLKGLRFVGLLEEISEVLDNWQIQWIQISQENILIFHGDRYMV